MREIIHPVVHITLVLMIAACTSKPPIDPEEMTLCKNPRPQACTMEYDPVCGHTENGKSASYSSACTACSDSKIIAYTAGDC
jgi:hypothetical protein